MGTQSGAMRSRRRAMPRDEGSAARAAAGERTPKVASSGGRPSAVVGGEIDASASEQRYEKLASIGSGGMGTVYRARQVALNREVALKEIRDLFGFFSEDQRNEIVRRFTDVVRAWGNLAHPNILPIHDVNLWVEYPERRHRARAERLGAPPDQRRRGDPGRAGVQVPAADAARAARRARAARLSPRPQARAAADRRATATSRSRDFGFTRIVERDHAVIRQIYVGMGNVAYMAPELYTDPMAAGPQGDIYALGIIFYELLTRKLPGRRSPMPSQINPTLPRGIDDIFDRMTRDARDERYATVDDILDDIDKLEGMDALLGRQNQVLVGESPLSVDQVPPGRRGAARRHAGRRASDDGDKKAGAPPVLVPAAPQQEDLSARGYGTTVTN